MNSIRFFLVLFLLLIVSSANSQWFKIYESESNYQGFFTNLYFIDQNTGYVVCSDSSIIKTTDSGLNWNQLTGTSNYNLSQIQFPSVNIGYALGNAGFNNAFLLKTTDSGNNWSFQNFPYYAFAMKFSDEYTGYITDDNGTVHKTTDGGSTWIHFTLNALQLTAIDLVNSDIVFIGTASNQKLFSSTNGGLNWQENYSPNFDFLKFINFSTGYGILNTTNHFLYKTTNSGATWFDIIQSDSSLFTGLYFINSNTGWLSESVIINNTFQRKLSKTINAGLNWFEQSTGNVSPDSNSCLGPIQMIDDNFGYALSNYCVFVGQPSVKGRIYKTTNGGGEPIGIINNQELSNGFKLNQNYPNPFNPATVISFHLPRYSYVIIRLFDAVGSELSILSEGYLQSGYNEILFNGENLPSGVYFYQVRSENFIDTKKMVLIK